MAEKKEQERGASKSEERIKVKKETKDIKDIVEKEFLGFPDVAEDLFNVLLYDGKQVAKKENLLAGPTETIYQGEDRLKNQFEDLCMYELEEGKVSLMYLIANQSQVDNKMLLRKAGYTGGAYRSQYEGKMPDTFPVIEMVLYWGEEKWKSDSTFREFFEDRRIPEKKWKYIDEMKLHVFQMYHLPEETRKLFRSDLRIIVDFLAEGKSYCSDRKIVHKAALMKMIKVLSGDMDIDQVEAELEEQGIREEDEVKVCELFDQYERRGRAEGEKIGRAEGEKLGRTEGEKLGIVKGEERLGKLMNFLMDCGRHDDAKRAAIDPSYRQQLYVETSLG